MCIAYFKMKRLEWNKESQQALNLSKEKKHLEAYPIYEKLYKKINNAVTTFNLFQCAVYCGKTDVEKLRRIVNGRKSC